MILAVTGHRPDKLGGYSSAAHEKLAEFAKTELLAIQRERQFSEPIRVLTGMALGWDQAIAYACIEMVIPFEACVPCDNQDAFWPHQSRDWYRYLLDNASKVTVVSPGRYAAWKMLRRNRYMVENCHELLALWDGSDGGTAHCVREAQDWLPAITINNCWQRWQSFRLPS